MNKQYITYLLKSRKHLLLSLVLIELLILVSVRVSICPSMVFGVQDYLTSLSMFLMACAGILAIVLPITFLSFVNSRSASDCIFALPLSRRELIVSTEVFVIAVNAVLYTVMEVAAMISLVPYYVTFHIGAYLLHFVIMYIGIAVVSLFTSTIYLLANNLVDGLILVSGYYVIPFLVYLVAVKFDDAFVAGFGYLSEKVSGTLSFPWVFAMAAGNTLDAVCERGQIGFLGLFAVSGLIHTAVSCYGLKKLFVERKSESAGQISDRKMGYPFLFAVYSIGTTAMVTLGAHGILNITGNLVIYTVIFVFYLIFSFIYRRAVRIHAKDVILFVCAILFANMLNVAAYQTKGFGFSWNYDHNASPVRYRYSYYAEDNAVRHLVPADAEMAEITFEMTVDNSEKDSSARQIMEQMRIQAIEDFYGEAPESRYGWLNIFDNYVETENSASYSRVYSYYCMQELTLEDLKTISQYGDVNVCWWVDGEYNVSTLPELLENVE